MLNEKQSGKLRLCLILLITAAVCFVACTVIGTIMAQRAQKVPATIPADESDLVSDAALKAFTDLYRSYSGDETFPKSLSAYRAALSSYGETLETIKIRMAGYREQAERANDGLASGESRVTVESLMAADSRFVTYYLPYLGLGSTASQWSLQGDDAGDEETTAQAPMTVTETAVSTALNSRIDIADKAQKTLDQLSVRNEMLNLDWSVLIQARLGLPLPPDARINGEDAQSVERQYEWDALKLDNDPETEPNGDRPEVKTGSILWTVALCAAVALALAASWLALRFAEKGRKLEGVICASLFTLLALPLAVIRLWAHINLLRAGFDWQPLAGAVGYGAALLFILLFYGYAYTAHRVKSRKLFTASLILGIVAILALAVRSGMPVLALMGRSGILSGTASLAFILLNAGRLLLWMLTILALALGMRRSSEKSPAAEPSMYPVLDAYRVNLRKERA